MTQFIKPSQVGLLFRPFDNDGKVHLCVTVPILFDLDTGAPLPDVDIYKLAAEVLDEGATFDEIMFKPQGELLVSGYVYPPEGQTACKARVAVGPIDKSLYAIGDRFWKANGTTDPEPFEAMRISYENAFGGEGHAKNPVGKGVASTTNEEGARSHPLPNLERPDALVTSPSQKPEPATFGPIHIDWPNRRSKLGTYDDEYMRERFPGFAADIDWTYYNVAPQDQQLEGFFEGDEQIVLENLHRERARIESQLPSLVGRCAIRRAGKDLEDLPLRLDTVHLFPYALAGALIFRGVTTVTEDDASDLEALLVACERKGEPRPLSHYEKVIALRADPERGSLHALRDGDLLPEGIIPAEGEVAEIDELLATSGALMANQRRGYKHQLEEVHRRMEEAGFDRSAMPEPEEPELEPVPARHELADFVEKLEVEIDKQRAEAEKQQAAVEERVRARCAEMNLDYDEVMTDEDAGRPPKLDAEARYQSIVERTELMNNAGVAAPELETQIADGSLRVKLLRMEADLQNAYRQFAHWFPEAKRLEGDAATRLRDEVIDAVRKGESLAGRDLTGADLSGLDLSGIDLSGAFVGSSNLKGCRLDGADLTSTVLARTDLSGASLVGATLARTNFGEATLDGADFGEGARLEGTVLVKASLTETKLSRAELVGVDVMDASLSEAVLDGLRAERSLFLGVDLTRAELTGSRLRDCVFLYAKAQGVQAAGADWTGTTWLDSRLDEAMLDGATCTNLRVVGDSSLAKASLRGVKLDEATLERCDMTGVDLTEANLRRSVFSHSDLTDARIHRADATGAMFMRACLKDAQLTDTLLLDALLGNADLRGCDLSGSYLFRADLTRVVTSGDTKVSEAEIRFCSFVERREQAQEGA